MSSPASCRSSARVGGGMRVYTHARCPGSIVKQPSVVVLAAETGASSVRILVCPLSPERFFFRSPKRAEPVFTPTQKGGARLHSQKREQSAVWRKESVPLQGARDRSCRTGLALRRSTAAS